MGSPFTVMPATRGTGAPPKAKIPPSWATSQ